MLPVFEKAEDVPEAFKASYEEKDGKWHPKELGEAGKKALDAERKAKDDAIARATKAERDLAEAETKRKAAEAGLSDEQLTKLRTEVRADVEKEFAEKYKDYEPTKAENRSLKLDSQVKKLALENGVRAERVEQWWTQFGSRFDLTNDGKPMVKSSPGTEVAKLISGDLKKEFPELYVGTQGDGGGAKGTSGAPVGSGAMKYEDFQKMTPAQQAEWARKNEQK